MPMFPMDDVCLMPWPQRVIVREGEPLPIRALLATEYPRLRTRRIERAVERLAQQFGGSTDSGGGRVVPLVIDSAGAGADFPALGDDESHHIAVTSAGIRVSAAEEWGVLRALATLTQLSAGEAVPCVEITDAPRFPWRGLMLDVARHFIPLADLLRTLEAMSVFKLNVLHLHLSDDQGFRFPSRHFPHLPSAEHYREAELAELVTAAADRGIRVVPELDVPGHATSWLTAYPQWGNRPAEASRRFGVHPACLDPTRQEVLAAVEAVFGELAAVFPDPYLHLGGDEVHPDWWTQDDAIQAFMREHGSSNAAALQARFNRHLAEMLGRLGRRALAWDDVVHPELAAPMTVQAWRGATARDRALGAGHDCVVSAPYYLDLVFPADVHYLADPAAPEAELIAAEDDLLADPRFSHVAAGMAWTRHWRDHKPAHAVQAPGRLLGAEACLWSELVDARVLDVRLWSRMPALAERFWSAADRRDVADMYRRLQEVLTQLPRWAGVDVAGDAKRLAAEAGLSERWRPLADVLEPVKWYGRLLGEDALAARLSGREMPQARPYDADSALNRVVDALPPESLACVRLKLTCEDEAAGDVTARAALLELAEVWCDLPARGEPPELREAARRLRELGETMRALLTGAMGTQAARERFARAGPPMGEYLLAPVPVLIDWLGRRAPAAPPGTADA